ncbi:MAG: transglutaminase domain-containing protein [Algibacter sp.]
MSEVLFASGNNSKNLEAVLNHYKEGDQQKYKAAVFLIKNMSIHDSWNYKWRDRNKKTVPFNELDYKNFIEASEVLTGLKDSLGLKAYKFKEEDLKTISTEFLIKNIDQAFLEWRSNSWSKTYDFDAFCEYILPYRSLIEPLQEWREDYKILVFKGAADAIDSINPADVATHALFGISEFNFSRTSPSPIPLLGAKSILFKKKGTCPDLANAALFACRSIGVAATFDFTPHYGASSNRHYWNTVIDNTGKHIPFNGSSFKDGLPYIYNPTKNKRLAKVYRRTFSIQQEALINVISKTNMPKGFLRSANIKDVTHEYVNSGKINYTFEKNKTNHVGFINVFNLGKWRVIDWANIENSSCVFKNLGTDIVYLPGTYLNNEMILESYPILLDSNKQIHILKPDFNNTYEANISKLNEHLNNYRDYNTLNIKDGDYYVLQYWCGEWINIGKKKKAEIDGIRIKNVPQNTLFRLLPDSPDGFERIFIIDKASKKIRWY